MPHTSVTRRSIYAPLSLAALLVTALALTGCSTGSPPEETLETLTEVKEDPTPPEAAEDLDIDTAPAPIVEPLECTPYLVITVRGTGEPHKRQLVSPVARLISEARPDQVATIDLDYPATGQIKEGATQGIRTLIDTLNQQADVCPGQQLMVLGYSQGALVIGESLIRPDVRLLGETVGEISPAAAAQIAAIVLYADPRFVGSDSFARGDFNPLSNGLLERPKGALDRFAERTRSYCVAPDFICQSRAELNEEGHVAYYDNGMQQDGAAFAITRMRGSFESVETDE